MECQCESYWAESPPTTVLSATTQKVQGLKGRDALFLQSCDRKYSHFLYHSVYDSCAADDRKDLAKLIKTASTACDIYDTCMLRMGQKIINDPSHPANALFVPLSSGKGYTIIIHINVYKA